MDIKKFSLRIIGVYCFICILFYFIVGTDITYGTLKTDMLALKTACPGLEKGQQLTQKFVCPYDRLDSITILPGTYERENTDIIHFSVTDEAGGVLFEKELQTSEMLDLTPYLIEFGEGIYDAKNRVMNLIFESMNGDSNNGIGYSYGDSVSTIKGGVKQEIAENEKAYVDGNALEGKLCFEIQGTEYYYWGKYYWQIFLGGLISIIGYLGYVYYCKMKGKRCLLLQAAAVCSSYGFLIKQMVSRDFKTKYKRSALGALWSLLNPLLTLAVQYFVFSTLFSNAIENYPIYLLIGIICYNFFTEAVGMNVTSITGNASLITKVYMPKYIFPVARALSSLINLVISLIPLIFFLVITKTKVALSWLLVPFPIACLFVFSLGFGMLLATMMVFFRDTAFLWGIISMFWMYLTPIFYSADIIPPQYISFYKMNPLYHIIGFMRTCFIEGHSPEPIAYLICAAMSFAMLILGLLVFKKQQDKFVLNI